MSKVRKFRVATYNIHKCKGLDQRIRPERIIKVLQEIDADIVALQEVVCVQGVENKNDQAHFIARELGYDFRLGENRKLRGAAYGNVVLSRLPMIKAHNHDISVRGREQRGCLRVDIDLRGGHPLHFYNVHLGTSYTERRHQARKLLNDEILKNIDHTGAQLLLGDFNEWTRGLTSRLLAEHFKSADIRIQMGRTRTYPGVLPFLHLDHIYYDDALKLEKASLHRSRTALIASDHLPVVADFQVI
jgi:endonuclease/exonuclease/phosphatase family metal-dependent hydrolase